MRAGVNSTGGAAAAPAAARRHAASSRPRCWRRAPAQQAARRCRAFSRTRWRRPSWRWRDGSTPMNGPPSSRSANIIRGFTNTLHAPYQPEQMQAPPPRPCPAPPRTSLRRPPACPNPCTTSLPPSDPVACVSGPARHAGGGTPRRGPLLQVGGWVGVGVLPGAGWGGWCRHGDGAAGMGQAWNRLWAAPCRPPAACAGVCHASSCLLLSCCAGSWQRWIRTSSAWSCRARQRRPSRACTSRQGWLGVGQAAGRVVQRGADGAGG